MTTILVTNDDGIASPGLCALAAAARDEGHEVIVAGPRRQSSGTSASIVAAEEDGRIQIERRDLAGLEGVTTFAVRGAPGLIALIAAHGAFGAVPDVVLSGINHGANVGRAILHSGTVGAALTGGLNGARALAVSLDVGISPAAYHWDAAAAVTRQVLPTLLASSPGTVLNLNVPNAKQPAELREAHLAPFGIVQTTMKQEDAQHITLAVEDLPNEPEPGSDAALLAEGFATVTSISPVSAVPLEVPLEVGAVR
ncbi:MAG TPA: 5'/3'-nucleotidase SurE [Rhodoglobus sp.]|nr:5'/3'-nucleotidase SurE [Rhodoglobus sp.]